MSQGSMCPVCGFQTEKLLLACPRCQSPLVHEHCKNCGRCPGPQIPSTEKRAK